MQGMSGNEGATVSGVVAVSIDGDLFDIVDYVIVECVVSIPGHASHEKSLERQISVGTLVSSQEQIALLVALINRG